VVLVDTSEKTFRRSAGVDDDGNFSVNFVPSGTYTMTVGSAADTIPEERKPGETLAVTGDRTVRSYDGTERQVIVADDDLTGQNFELKPEKPGNAGDAGGGQAHAVVETGH
jgi:VCBS repeat-containing protein